MTMKSVQKRKVKVQKRSVQKRSVQKRKVKVQKRSVQKRKSVAKKVTKRKSVAKKSVKKPKSAKKSVKKPKKVSLKGGALSKKDITKAVDAVRELQLKAQLKQLEVQTKKK